MEEVKKDWVGGYNSVFKTLGARNNCKEEREPNDYYATHGSAIDKLTRKFTLPHKIYEPMCGEGHLSKRLIELGHDVYSTDLVDRGYGVGGVDFLRVDAMPEGYSCILTNPAYKIAQETILHALDILPDRGLLVMFLKTSFLEGKRRRTELYDVTPPQVSVSVLRTHGVRQKRRL